ncbi:hypothetical protein STEG23_028429, partial [Scotinomys teguina]
MISTHSQVDIRYKAKNNQTVTNYPNESGKQGGNTLRLAYDMITFILQHIIKNSIFNLTETSCFWRIKHNEEDDGDLRNDCEILLLLSQEPIEEYFYKRIINF